MFQATPYAISMRANEPSLAHLACLGRIWAPKAFIASFSSTGGWALFRGIVYAISGGANVLSLGGCWGA